MPRWCQHKPLAPESCHLCMLYVTREDYRAAWDGAPAPRPPAPRPAPCAHEGHVLQWCHGCNGPMRHVRECVHPDNPTETCTRGAVSLKVWACATCPHYAPE